MFAALYGIQSRAFAFEQTHARSQYAINYEPDKEREISSIKRDN